MSARRSVTVSWVWLKNMMYNKSGLAGDWRNNLQRESQKRWMSWVGGGISQTIRPAKRRCEGWEHEKLFRINLITATRTVRRLLAYIYDFVVATSELVRVKSFSCLFPPRSAERGNVKMSKVTHTMWRACVSTSETRRKKKAMWVFREIVLWINFGKELSSERACDGGCFLILRASNNSTNCISEEASL